jgi:hypothetical protein
LIECQWIETRGVTRRQYDQFHGWICSAPFEASQT